MAPDQGLYSESTNTVGTGSIMQVTRVSTVGTTGCHAPTRSLQTGIIQGPSLEFTWEQRLSVASSGQEQGTQWGSPGNRLQGGPTPTLGTPPPPLPGYKYSSACLPCHQCSPSTEPGLAGSSSVWPQQDRAKSLKPRVKSPWPCQKGRLGRTGFLNLCTHDILNQITLFVFPGVSYALQDV